MWKGLTSRETARALADREGEGIPPTSSVGVLGATAHESPRPHEPLVDQRGVHVKSSLRNGSKMSNDAREPQPRVVVGVTLRMGQRRHFTMVLVVGVTHAAQGACATYLPVGYGVPTGLGERNASASIGK